MNALTSTGPNRAAHRGHESGQVVILVAVALTALLGMTALAIDAGLLRVAHGQLQAAASASAMAGAAGLRNLGPTGALERATLVAESNRALADRMRPITVAPGDIELIGPRRVRVTLSRSAATGGGVLTAFTSVLGLERERTVRATAEAEAIEVGSTRRMRPLAIPDRWADLNGNGTYDAGEPYSPFSTGYQPQRDEGLVLTLEPYEHRRQEPATQSSYLRIRLPAIGAPETPPRPGVGNYRRFLLHGAPYDTRVGDDVELQTVPVHMTTYRILRQLIEADRGARWDPQQTAVVGRAPGLSPRVIEVALVDPRTLPPAPDRDGDDDHGDDDHGDDDHGDDDHGDDGHGDDGHGDDGHGDDCDDDRDGRRDALRIVRLAAVFVESVCPDGTLRLRLIPYSGDGDECPRDETSFVYRTRLTR